jgi:hypothetical protein
VVVLDDEPGNVVVVVGLASVVVVLVVAVVDGVVAGMVVVVATLGAVVVVVGVLTISPLGPTYTSTYGGRTTMYVVSAARKIPTTTQVDILTRLARASLDGLGRSVTSPSRRSRPSR